MSAPLKVVILNAYSRTNAGDGLLVDEAAKLIRERFGDVELRLVSMAPESFPEFPGGLNPIAGPSSDMKPAQLLRTLLTGKPHPTVAQAIADADLAVAVGGGYLRGASCVGLAKTVLSHLCQAPTRNSTTPYVYLPQSIGPFPSPRIPLGLGRLRRARVVFVRDDRSLTLARAFKMPVQRMPDLAALALGERPSDEPAARPLAGRVGVVGRSLGNKAEHYDAKFVELVKRTDGELLVQSRGRGNDDPSYYRRLGYVGERADLLPALTDAARRHSVIVSVRLHGSLQSILAGIPSIHLSYERKGWGAYDDLGISRFVHNAKSFDPDEVLAQIAEIEADPSAYWDAIERSRPQLLAAKSRLSNALGNSARRGVAR